MDVEFTPENSHTMRAWTQCCKAESIDPYEPSRLPLLFAIDTDLKIPDGFNYDLVHIANIADAYRNDPSSGSGHAGHGCGGGCGGD